MFSAKTDIKLLSSCSTISNMRTLYGRRCDETTIGPKVMSFLS